MDLCNCNNNTDSSRLRMVRGNDFSTLYTINAKYADDTPVPNWDITQCTDISIKVHRVSSCKGVDSTKDISAYGSYRFANTNVLIIDWDGLLMKVGTYSVDFAAKFDGVDIRWYSKQEMVFDIVESNEEANIPEDSFIEDGIYRLDGDFVLMFGVQQQADWDEEDPTHPAYIKNRPEGIDTRDLLRKDEAALIYLAKADAHIPEHGSLDTSTKEMNFYDEDDNLLFSIDATAALKDASVSNITYSDGYLTFQFNSDAERPTIQFYIGDAFDSSDYYNKVASDLRYVTSTTLLDYYTAQEVNALVNPINAKIPSAASSSNQLADKAFVNSSVSTATATFRGTSATGLTESQFITWANSLTHDLNDYVYWNTTDTAGNTVYKRYKYNGSSWVYEYDLNNSSFTSSEWAAIQSGITSSLVSKLSALPTNSQLTTALNNKQDTIGDLSDIRSGAEAGSTAYQLPLGGVPDTDIASASTWNAKQNALVSGTNIKTVNNQSLLGSGNITIEGGGDDNVIESITMNGNAVTITNKNAAIVESDPVFAASPAYGITSSDITKWDAAAVVAEDDGSATIPDFDAEADTVWHKAQTLSSAQKSQARTNIGAQEALTFDSAPTSASTNPVTSGGVYTALGNKQDTLVSGTSIKTINSTSLLGSGNVAVQETLVSGTNIKTINNQSLLGSGNITIQGGSGSGVQSDWNETDTTSEAYILNKPNIPSVISAEFSYDSTNEGLVITPTNAAVYDSTTECLTIL